MSNFRSLSHVTDDMSLKSKGQRKILAHFGHVVKHGLDCICKTRTGLDWTQLKNL